MENNIMAKDVKMKNIAQALMNESLATGCVDLNVIGCGGTYLSSKENITSEYWYEDSEMRGDFDASGYDYWITTDDGFESPSGYDTAEQLSDFLNNVRENMPESFIPIFSVSVKAEARGNAIGYTPSDYANDVAAEINKMSGDQGRSSDYDWFERALADYKEPIGFNLLFIKLDSLFEVEEE